MRSLGTGHGRTGNEPAGGEMGPAMAQEAGLQGNKSHGSGDRMNS